MGFVDDLWGIKKPKSKVNVRPKKKRHISERQKMGYRTFLKSGRV
jgi:hypothetical protein